MKALICGVGGQDGAYLARLLLEKGYEVVGTSRDAMASQSQHGFDVEYERILGGRSLPYWKKLLIAFDECF